MVMKQSIHLREKLSKYPSTLLIPQKELKKLDSVIRKYGSARNFVHKAVLSKHWLLAIQARKESSMTLYQEKGQDLHRFDFRPYEKDWERFRMLAMNQRVSMTRLFVLLLVYWDGEVVGVPTDSQIIILNQRLFKHENQIFLRLNRLII